MNAPAKALQETFSQYVLLTGERLEKFFDPAIHHFPVGQALHARHQDSHDLPHVFFVFG
jgi:hypothetical protein